MKKFLTFFLCGILLVSLSSQNKAGATEDKISEDISRLIEVLELVPQAGCEQTKEFILDLLDSILLMAPKLDIPKELQSEIETHVDAYRESDNVIIHANGVEALWKTAQFINPDFDLNLPDRANPAIIKEDIRLELHQAQSFHAQGKDESVMEILLRTLLRIVTPVKD